MKLKSLSLLAALLLVPALDAPSANATTVLQVDVSEMTTLSEWVVRARVVSTQSVDLRPQGKGLYTDVELAISEVYRGQDVPARYTLRLMGGVGDDGLALKIPGMPTFTQGEQVVLFLERTSLGHVPCGLGQGVWRLDLDPAGRTWVRQSAKSLHILRRSGDGALRPAQPVFMTAAKTLAELVHEVYAAQLPPAPSR